jgi:hypothetical protein
VFVAGANGQFQFAEAAALGHYSAPEIRELLEAANRVAETKVRTLLRVIA